LRLGVLRLDVLRFFPLPDFLDDLLPPLDDIAGGSS
jgi:hypothetical protein